MSLDITFKGADLVETECWHCGHVSKDFPNVFDINITSNLRSMADAAGFGPHLWYPEENEVEVADDLILPLEAGIQDMVARPDYYKQFNAENGWGKYEDLLRFAREVLRAAKEYPTAIVNSSR